MPENLRLEGYLEEIKNPVYTNKGYLTNVVIKTEEASMPVTILGCVRRFFLHYPVVLTESYDRDNNKRVFQQELKPGASTVGKRKVIF
jgi:hypothetical protein